MKVITDALKTLQAANNKKPDSKVIVVQLDIIKSECDKGIEMRVAAGRSMSLNHNFSLLKSEW